MRIEGNELEFTRHEMLWWHDLGMVFIKVVNTFDCPKALGRALVSLRAADEELYKGFLKDAIDYTALELDRLAVSHSEREREVK